MTRALALVTLVVRDYDEAIAFFTRSLGFTLVEDTPLGGGKRWVVVAPPGGAGAALLLARAGNEAQALRVGDPTGGRVAFFLHTDDIDRDIAEMRDRGVRFVREPRRESYGTVAVFHDLYGNAWDLIQPSLHAPLRIGVPPKAPGAAISFRDTRPADLPAFFEHQRDAEASRTAAVATRGEEAFHEHWNRIVADGRIVKRTALLGEEPAGYGVCFERDGERLVGYWIGRAFQGRGIATRAVADLVAIVSDRPLTARVAKRNGASLRVLGKNGFRIVGEDRLRFGEPEEIVEELVLRLDASPAVPPAGGRGSQPG